MKVKIEGKRDLSTLRNILNTIIDRLEQEGVDEVAGINFYFNPYQDNQKVEFVSENGEPVYWTYTEPKKIKKPPTNTKQKPARHLKAL